MDLHSFSIAVNGKKHDMVALCVDGKAFLHLNKLLAACDLPKSVIQNVIDFYRTPGPIAGGCINDAQCAGNVYVDPDDLFRVLPDCVYDKNMARNYIRIVNAMQTLNIVIKAVSDELERLNDPDGGTGDCDGRDEYENDSNDSDDDEILFHDIAVRTRAGIAMVHAGLVNKSDYMVECLSLLRAAGMTPEKWECLKHHLPFQDLYKIEVETNNGGFVIPLLYGAPHDYADFVDGLLDVSRHCRDEDCSEDVKAMAKNMKYLLKHLPEAFDYADAYVDGWYELPDFIDDEYDIDDDDNNDGDGCAEAED